MTQKSQLVARKSVKKLLFFSIEKPESVNFHFPLVEFNNSNEFL